MLFEVQGLSQSFGRIQALSGVSFEVRAGEVLGLIGPNGAGKSTLFECLAGVLPSNKGHVLQGGRRIPMRERSCVALLSSRWNRAAGATSGLAIARSRSLLDRSAWHELKMTVDGASFKTWLDGTLAIEYTLGTEPAAGRRGPPNPDLFPANNPVLRPPVAGRAGPWSKTDSSSYFKDYVVSPK